ncbi:cyclin-like protein [Serendipita vermifera]|nr:cyclin-like protein [Serendipita vermifera]
MDLDGQSNGVKESSHASPSISKPGNPSSSLQATSKTRAYRPYFTHEEVTSLSIKQRTGGSEETQEKARQLACSFIEAVGNRMGFPRKTIGTAQMLYHRFRLFFPVKDFNPHDVSQATLYVSAKLHDTIKKPQDILEASYIIRYPNLVNTAGNSDIDAERKAEDRRKLLTIERLILETICFNFTVQMAFPYVIKFSKELHVSKELAKLAWRLCADSHRTVVGLEYPPHAVGLACIYLACLLATFELNMVPASEETTRFQAVIDILSKPGEWEAKYLIKVDDLAEICQAILDLLVSRASMAPQSYHTSPTTPSSPSPYPSPRTPNPFKSTTGASVLPTSEEAHVFTAPHLTRLKIALREQEKGLRDQGYVFRKRPANRIVQPDIPILAQRQLPVASGQSTPGEKVETVNGSIGKNEGTVRFLFGPERP